jgi:hypothetical protein
MDSNGHPKQYSEEFKIERDCSQSEIGQDDHHNNINQVIEERTEESSSRNHTPPSAINPMEGTNYQDELNNFIMSRAAKGPNNNNNLSMNLPTSGLTSANNSNR